MRLMSFYLIGILFLVGCSESDKTADKNKTPASEKSNNTAESSAAKSKFVGNWNKKPAQPGSINPTYCEIKPDASFQITIRKEQGPPEIVLDGTWKLGGGNLITLFPEDSKDLATALKGKLLNDDLLEVDLEDEKVLYTRVK